MGMQMSYHLDAFLLVGGGMKSQLCGDTVWSLPKTALNADELSPWLAFSLARNRQRAIAKTNLRLRGRINLSANSSGYLALSANLLGGPTPPLTSL